MTDWNTRPLWAKQIERRLHEVSSLVKGNLPTQADRIADVVEQIHELRKEVEQLRSDMEEHVENIREAYKKLKNGG